MKNIESYLKLRRSSAGIRNARVFPLPVAAQAQISFPMSPTGMAFAYNF